MLLLSFCRSPEMGAASSEEKEKAATADSDAAPQDREPERERNVEYVEKKVLVVDDDGMNRKLVCCLPSLVAVC